MWAQNIIYVIVKDQIGKSVSWGLCWNRVSHLYSDASVVPINGTIVQNIGPTLLQYSYHFS